MQLDWHPLHSVWVDGLPKGQPRARSRRGFTGVYDPGTADGWKAQVQLAFQPVLPDQPINEPLKIDIAWYMKRPGSFTTNYRKILREQLGLRKLPSTALPFIGKPDRDNLDKAILDALTQANYMRDDSIVVAGSLVKLYHEVGGKTGALIRVYRLKKGATP